MQNMADFIASTRAQVATLKVELEALNGVLLDEAYIVQIDGVNVSFPERADGVMEKPFPCAVHKCMRFKYADADHLARLVKNGAGKRGTAVHIRPAMAEAIATLQTMLDAYDRAK